MISTYQNIADLISSIKNSQGLIINTVEPISFGFIDSGSFPIDPVKNLFYGTIIFNLQVADTTNNIIFYTYDKNTNPTFFFAGKNISVDPKIMNIHSVLASVFVVDTMSNGNLFCYANGYKLTF